MVADWNLLSDDLQIAISREAMRRASDAIAGQAELLAGEIEEGALSDRGGPNALRLLAALVRLGGEDAYGCAGHA
ncbi:MAG: hypothetical protein ACREFV_02250 [Acetobacteraceae bacterium]